jgi:hypothetical protein
MSRAVFKPAGGPLSSHAVDLNKVIDAFGQLQDVRYIADYDVGRIWSRLDVTNTLEIVDDAFVLWKAIRNEKMAQDHLLTMFGARRV